MNIYKKRNKILVCDAYSLYACFLRTLCLLSPAHAIVQLKEIFFSFHFQIVTQKKKCNVKGIVCINRVRAIVIVSINLCGLDISYIVEKNKQQRQRTIKIE